MELCPICGTKHESYQAHVFTSETGKRFMFASAKERLTNGDHRNGSKDGDSKGVLHSAERNEAGRPDAYRGGGNGDIHTARSANGRSKDAYNAYMREYMKGWRKRRAG